MPEQTGEGAVLPPEDRSAFAEIEHAELIDRYYRTQGEDLGIGRELALRLFEHAGFPRDPRGLPLIGRDNTPVLGNDGKPLMLVDYVNWAAEHHTEALPSILDFLLMAPGTIDYEGTRAAMLARIEGQ